MADYEIIDDMYIYYVEFPKDLSREHEMVMPCLDGYTVYINLNLDRQGKLDAIEHAKGHIRAGDVDRRDGDVQEIEARAHGIKPEIRKLDPETAKAASIWHKQWVEAHKRYVAYLNKELDREHRMAEKDFYYDQVEDALDRRERMEIV
ncbi:MAG: hypothetical protein PUE63_03125 [Lachnospiraceae bacterium]|nr:hypothetical protein [Lachnospiraceae bacterium]